MDWMESLKDGIAYIEANLECGITPENVAKKVHVSPFYFQKGFSILSGYTIGEYIRKRRLYLAALDLLADKEKVIDIAFKYGYDTPESFTKAFVRFHGMTPSQVKGNVNRITVFLPLTIKISVQGGIEMKYSIEKMQTLQMIGFEKKFSYDNAYEEIPKFWDECMALIMNENDTTGCHKAAMKNSIGEFGVSIDNEAGTGKFTYFIAGGYRGGDVPKEMKTFEIPASKWAKFDCTGPMPGALQSVNTKIFKEWLPGNPDYEIAMEISIEWYERGDTKAADYKSGIWIPVKRK